MSLLESVAILAGTFLAMTIIGAVVLAQWRGVPAGPLPLYEMLRRQNPRSARTQCREWLDSGKREGFDEFCENAAYVSRMRAIAE